VFSSVLIARAVCRSVVIMSRNLSNMNSVQVCLVDAGSGQKLVEYFAFCIWKSVWNKSRYSGWPSCLYVGSVKMKLDELCDKSMRLFWCQHLSVGIGTSAQFPMSLVVHEVSMKLGHHLGWLLALSFLWCFSAVGWVTGTASGLTNVCHLSPNFIIWKNVEAWSQGANQPWFTWKMVLNGERYSTVYEIVVNCVTALIDLVSSH